jgi:hypothetical protein
MKGKLLKTQLPSRKALYGLGKTQHTLSDYGKVTPITERDPRPQLILRKDEYAR